MDNGSKLPSRNFAFGDTRHVETQPVNLAYNFRGMRQPGLAGTRPSGIRSEAVSFSAREPLDLKCFIGRSLSSQIEGAALVLTRHFFGGDASEFPRRPRQKPLKMLCSCSSVLRETRARSGRLWNLQGGVSRVTKPRHVCVITATYLVSLVMSLQ